MMNQSTFQKWAFHIDPETKSMLETLAKSTMRSQAAMLRVLIHEAYTARAKTQTRKEKRTATTPSSAMR